MEILTKYASIGYDLTEADKFNNPLGNDPEVFLYSAVDTPDQEFSPELHCSTEGALFGLLQEERARRLALGTCRASLELVFLPSTERGKGFALTKDNFRRLFRDIGLHESLLPYLASSRSGWYHIDNGNGIYSFLFKEYLYSMSWTFNAKTLETRALVSERSAYRDHSFLKSGSERDARFDLPGLDRFHLYHPLTLACFVLIDASIYVDRLIVTDGYSLGEIEKLTGHGRWARRQEMLRRLEEATAKEKEIMMRDYRLEDYQPLSLTDLDTATRKIAQVIGVFTSFAKSIGIANHIATTLKDSKHWRDWLDAATAKADYSKQHKKQILEQFDIVAQSMLSAAQLVCDRIHSANESSISTQKRAKAQAKVIAAIMIREDNRIGHQLADRTGEDSRAMKAIALMTMAFLPATFYAALWSIPMMEKSSLATDVWVYWAFTIPTTIAIFLFWYLLNNRRKIKKLIAPSLSDDAGMVIVRGDEDLEKGLKQS